mmetsp:Transcript_49104/g.104528  ORF Transcript_49104/g.104528 Transcript_49104/m.104528 type:complete len:206 (-) Transcript_49104:1415-2032(-)
MMMRPELVRRPSPPAAYFACCASLFSDSGSDFGRLAPASPASFRHSDSGRCCCSCCCCCDEKWEGVRARSGLRRCPAVRSGAGAGAGGGWTCPSSHFASPSVHEDTLVAVADCSETGVPTQAAVGNRSLAPAARKEVCPLANAAATCCSAVVLRAAPKTAVLAGEVSEVSWAKVLQPLAADPTSALAVVAMVMVQLTIAQCSASS